MPFSSDECGEVREAELPEFLALMTDAFGLEAEGAARVFQSDPYFSLSNKRVLRHHGKIVSILTLVEREASLRDNLFSMVGLCGVATLPEHRKKGFASRLIGDTLTRLRHKKVPFVLLNPIEADYYRRLGWEYAVFSDRLVTKPAQLPVTPEIAQVCTLSRHDIYALSLIYDETASEGTLGSFILTRDTKRWNFLLDYLPNGVIFRPKNGVPEGYLIYERTENLLANGGSAFVLKVQEFRVRTERARRGLLSFLAKQPVDLIQFEGQSEHHLKHGLLNLLPLPGETETLPQIECRPTVMARIVDFEAALQAYRPPAEVAMETTTIRCLLHDAQHPQGVQEAILTLRSSPSAVVSPDEIAHLPTLTAEVAIWTRVLLGAMSGEDALALGLMQASDEATYERVAQLFPLRRPFLSPLDYF